MTEKLSVTVAEATEMVGVGRSTGYALVASGEWPSITIGRSRLVLVDGLSTWVKERARAVELEEAEGHEAAGELPPAA